MENKKLKAHEHWCYHLMEKKKAQSKLTIMLSQHHMVSFRADRFNIENLSEICSLLCRMKRSYPPRSKVSPTSTGQWWEMREKKSWFLKTI